MLEYTLQQLVLIFVPSVASFALEVRVESYSIEEIVLPKSHILHDKLERGCKDCFEFGREKIRSAQDGYHPSPNDDLRFVYKKLLELTDRVERLLKNKNI